MFPPNQPFTGYALSNELNVCCDVPIMDPKFVHLTEPNLETVRNEYTKPNERGKLELSPWSDSFGIKQSTGGTNLSSWFNQPNFYGTGISTNPNDSSQNLVCMEDSDLFERLSSSLGSCSTNATKAATATTTSSTDMPAYGSTSTSLGFHNATKSYLSGDLDHVRSFGSYQSNYHHHHHHHPTEHRGDHEHHHQPIQCMPSACHPSRTTNLRLDSTDTVRGNESHDPTNSIPFGSAIRESVKHEFGTPYLNNPHLETSFSNSLTNPNCANNLDARQTEVEAHRLPNSFIQTNENPKSHRPLAAELPGRNIISEMEIMSNRATTVTINASTATKDTSRTFKTSSHKIGVRTKSFSANSTRGIRTNLTCPSSSMPKHTLKHLSTPDKKASKLKSFTAGELQNYEACFFLGTSSDESTASNAMNLSRSSYMCRKCRAHGKLLPVKQHKRSCPFRNCTCAVCSLVNYGRRIVARQIALYRDQKSHLPSSHGSKTGHTNDDLAMPGLINRVSNTKLSNKYKLKCGQSAGQEFLETGDEDGPHCRRCRNHGKSNPWKGHKKTCPFIECMCQQCILITLRKSNEKNLREVVQEITEERTDKRDKTSSKTLLGSSNLPKPQSDTNLAFPTASREAFALNSYWSGLNRKFQPSSVKSRDRTQLHLEQQSHPQQQQQPEQSYSTANEQLQTNQYPNIFPQSYLSRLSAATDSSWQFQPNLLNQSAIPGSNSTSLFHHLVAQTMHNSTKESDSHSIFSRNHATVKDDLNMNSAYPASMMSDISGNSLAQTTVQAEKSLDLAKGLSDSISEMTFSDNQNQQPLESQSVDAYGLSHSMFATSPYFGNMASNTETNHWGTYYTQRLNEYGLNSISSSHHLLQSSAEQSQHDHYSNYSKCASVSDLSTKFQDRDCTNFRRSNRVDHSSSINGTTDCNPYRDSTSKSETDAIFPNNYQFTQPDMNTDDSSKEFTLHHNHGDHHFKSNLIGHRSVLNSPHRNEALTNFQASVNIDSNVNPPLWVRPTNSTMVEDCLLGAAAVAAAEYHSQAHQAAAFAAAAAAAVALHNEVAQHQQHGQQYHNHHQLIQDEHLTQKQCQTEEEEQQNEEIAEGVGEHELTRSDNPRITADSSGWSQATMGLEIDRLVDSDTDTVTADGICKTDCFDVDPNNPSHHNKVEEFSEENSNLEHSELETTARSFHRFLQANLESNNPSKSSSKLNVEHDKKGNLYNSEEVYHTHDKQFADNCYEHPNSTDEIEKDFDQSDIASKLPSEDHRNYPELTSGGHQFKGPSQNADVDRTQDWLTTSSSSDRQAVQFLYSKQEAENSWINTP